MTRPRFPANSLVASRICPRLRPLFGVGVGAVLLALFACQRAAPQPSDAPAASPTPTADPSQTLAPAAPPKTVPAVGPAQLPPVTPGLELQDQDYSEARRQFHTKLLRKGPAPQPWRPVHAPAGVIEAEYPSGDFRLKAWVSPPSGEKGKRPAVLFLHGGWAFDEDDWEMSQPYRDAGYVVLTPLLRGENGQPGSFTMFYDEVDDVLAAAAYLAKIPYVDPDRIYLSGHSAGGTLTLIAAMASDHFRAAASFSGSPDRIAFAKRWYKSVVPFDESDNREYQLRSPVAYATSFKCPVRIYYGSQETYFRDESQRTALLASGHGLDVEAVVVPGDHQSSVPGAMRKAIDFFRQR